MDVTSIGGNVSNTVAEANNSNGNINRDEFLKLFLAQLNFQDPLEPVDNREFLTQMAQFTSLEIARTSDESLTNLVAMTSSDQGLSLLGKAVQVLSNGSTIDATVDAVHYTTNGATLSLKLASGEQLTDIPLGQVQVIRQQN
jgi:flagellar basal-body rod modification protein FlgD